MEKLIEIQSLIMKYEDLIGDETKYKSKFDFINDTKLKIQTFCRDRRITYEQMFEHGSNMVVYTKDNTTIEIHCW